MPHRAHQKSGQNGSGEFMSGQQMSGQSKSGQGYLHCRIGQWGLDGWTWMVGTEGWRAEDGGRRNEWTVDVARTRTRARARVEGEDAAGGRG